MKLDLIIFVSLFFSFAQCSYRNMTVDTLNNFLFYPEEELQLRINFNQNLSSEYFSLGFIGKFTDEKPYQTTYLHYGCLKDIKKPPGSFFKLKNFKLYDDSFYVDVSFSLNTELSHFSIYYIEQPRNVTNFNEKLDESLMIYTHQILFRVKYKINFKVTKQTIRYDKYANEEMHYSIHCQGTEGRPIVPVTLMGLDKVRLNRYLFLTDVGVYVVEVIMTHNDPSVTLACKAGDQVEYLKIKGYYNETKLGYSPINAISPEGNVQLNTNLTCNVLNPSDFTESRWVQPENPANFISINKNILYIGRPTNISDYNKLFTYKCIGVNSVIPKYVLGSQIYVNFQLTQTPKTNRHIILGVILGVSGAIFAVLLLIKICITLKSKKSSWKAMKNAKNANLTSIESKSEDSLDLKFKNPDMKKLKKSNPIDTV